MKPTEDPILYTSPHALAGFREQRRLLWCAALPVALVSVLLTVHLVLPFGRPSATVHKALQALASGDAARLRSEERLGFQRRAEREIKRRGEAEYARVLAIFDKEAQLGDREYRRIRKLVAQLGDKEFRRLSRDDQRRIRELSRRQFVADKGWALLSEDERKQLGAPDTLTDRAKTRARAIAVGLPTLSDEAREAADGQDLTSPEAAKDRKLARIAAQAERAGMEALLPALQSAEAAAAVELARLPRREQNRVENGAYVRWVVDAGLKAADDQTRARATVEQLVDEDAPAAWELRRSFGNKDLDPESRQQIASQKYDAFVAGRRAFVDREGMRLWGEKLREIFAAGCCQTATVRYLGDSGRSLLRNATATVGLEFGPPPAQLQKPTDEDDDSTLHPARRYLGQTVTLEYRWGSWAIVDFDAGAAEEPAQRPRTAEVAKAALGAFAGLGSGLSGFALFGALGLGVLLLVLWKRPGGVAVRPAELVAAGGALALAALQIAFEGQASLDDLWFTPWYLAIPIWIGVSRGSESGFVGGFLAGLGLLVASAVAGVPSWASAGGDTLLVGEHLLAALMLAGTGALAGRVRWPVELSAALPLVWLLFFAIIDRGQLAALSTWAHVLAACAVTAVGLLVQRTALLEPLLDRWHADAP